MPFLANYIYKSDFLHKTKKNNIPVIAGRAHAMAVERIKCSNFGMNDYASRSINSGLLFNKMYN